MKDGRVQQLDELFLYKLGPDNTALAHLQWIFYQHEFPRNESPLVMI